VVVCGVTPRRTTPAARTYLLPFCLDESCGTRDSFLTTAHMPPNNILPTASHAKHLLMAASSGSWRRKVLGVTALPTRARFCVSIAALYLPSWPYLCRAPLHRTRPHGRHMACIDIQYNIVWRRRWLAIKHRASRGSLWQRNRACTAALHMLAGGERRYGSALSRSKALKKASGSDSAAKYGIMAPWRRWRQLRSPYLRYCGNVSACYHTTRYTAPLHDNCLGVAIGGGSPR